MEEGREGLEGNIGLGVSSASPEASQSQPTAESVPATKENVVPAMSSQEEIGFHKGALNTLMAERNELVKVVGNVDAIMQAHVKRLKELGIEFK